MREIAGLPLGYRGIFLETVTSTNSWLLDRARDGEPSHLWVQAARQTAGRGRQGRGWMSEPGNLYASLLLYDPAPVERLGELPLVVALALHDALVDLLPPPLRPELLIKWPNDLLVQGAKIAGILVESAVFSGRRAVVIGCGVNAAHHPQTPLYPATDLSSLAVPTPPDVIFERLAGSLARRLAEWTNGPFANLRTAWMARAKGVGQPLRVRLANRELSGVFEDMDIAGRLVLRLDNRQIEAISAGDVFF
jgi:BirA family transcriptional regulator, biotin operon repressor / biotin---[acetyl-CoA-carboxylase] ligase